MKDYNLDRILAPAFKLFLTHNYEKVSTAMLEQETGLTRGAIFYKLKSKKDVFIAVIDKYILGMQSYNIIADSLAEYMDRYLEKAQERMNIILTFGVNNFHRAYFSLIYQALQYYPDFDSKIAAIFYKDLEKWETVIQMAKNNNEIKRTCNVKEQAKKFRYTYSGLSFERSLQKGLNCEELKRLYYSYYNEIKSKK